jgi:hypothetical protein
MFSWLAIVVEKIDAAVTSPHRTAAVHLRTVPGSTWQATLQ